MKLMKGVGRREEGRAGGDGDSSQALKQDGAGGGWLVKLYASGLWCPGGAWEAGSYGKKTRAGKAGGRVFPELREHSRETGGMRACVCTCFLPERRDRGPR